MENEFQLIKTKTHVLKVHIHCNRCIKEVKKILKKIEGVYVVSIDAEDHKAKVCADVGVDSATLIRKLIKSGKYAELCSTVENQEDEDSTTENLLHGQPNEAPNTQSRMMGNEFQLVKIMVLLFCVTLS